MEKYQDYSQQIIESNFEKIPQIPSHIAVEGSAGSGKSTLLAYLDSINQSQSVPEYSNFINWEAGETFPNFPPENQSEIIKSNSLWVKLEMRRKAELIKKASHPNLLIFTDRSPLSLFSFEHAKVKQNIPAEFTNLASIYTNLINIGMFKEPTGYIFLIPNSRTVLERIKIRGGKNMPFLNSETTINLIHEFLLFFAKRYLQESAYLIIDNTSLTVKETHEQVRQFLMSKNKQEENVGFRNFLQDILLEKN